MTDSPLKIYYNREPLFVLGPLGCFDRGGAVVLPDGRDALVVALDDDGAGLAYPVDYLRERAEAMEQPFEEYVDGLAKTRTCYRRDWAPERVQQQIDRVAALNREKFGVLTTERAAA